MYISDHTMNCLLKVFELSTDLIAISSLYGAIEAVNPAFQKALGYSGDKIKGSDIFSLLHEEDAPQAQKALRKSEEPSRPLELRIRDKRGHYRWVRLQSHLSVADQKRIFIAQDVTKQRKLQLQLDRTAPLQEVREELQRFNHLLSHDIKEPIRNIVSFTNLALREVPANSKLEEYFHYIVQNGKQLHLLINNLLLYNNIDKQQQEVFQCFEMEILIDRLKSNLSEIIEEKGGKLLSHNLPVIYGNERLIFMLFKHLLENGFLYNDSQEPKVEIHYDATSRYHQFLITDNGIGIETEFHQYIFDLFKRLHNRQDYIGTGIGLATAKKILDRLDGDIRIMHSKPGKGSAFLLRFPIITPTKDSCNEENLSESRAIAATE